MKSGSGEGSGFDNDEPKDWEESSETPPDKLRRKWDKEESEEPAAIPCPFCKKRVPGSSFFCMYCGNRIFEDSGILGRILMWVRRLFR